MTQRLQDINVGIAKRLLARLVAEYPDVVAYDDRQDWPHTVDKVPLPGTFGLVVLVGKEYYDEDGWKPALGSTSYSTRIVNGDGPPRLFLMAWDAKAGVTRVNSAPLFYEEVAANE